MRFRLILFLIILFAACAPSSEHMAKKGIESYLHKNMNDWKSYEPVDFGHVDPVFARHELSSEGMEYEREIEKNENLLQEENDSSQARKLQRRLDQLYTAKSMSKMYSPGKVLGYEVDHNFRSKNLAGGMQLHRFKFILDSKFKVLGVLDNEQFVDNEKSKLQRYMKYFYIGTEP